MVKDKITLTEIWLDASALTLPPPDQPWWDAFVWINTIFEGISIPCGFPLMPKGTDPTTLVRERIKEIRSFNHPVSHALLVHVDQRYAARAGNNPPDPINTEGVIVWTKKRDWHGT